MRSQFKDSALVIFANMVNDTEGVNYLIDQLESLKRFLFKDKEGTISKKTDVFLAQNLVPVFAEIEEKGLEPATDSAQLQFLDRVINNLKNLACVKAILAFEPSDTFIARLNSEISAEIGQKVIIDLVVDRHIVAGAIFEYEGRIFGDTLEEKLSLALARLIKNLSHGKASK